jgi:hypothetical protein
MSFNGKVYKILVVSDFCSNVPVPPVLDWDSYLDLESHVTESGAGKKFWSLQEPDSQRCNELFSFIGFELCVNFCLLLYMIAESQH